MTKRNIMSTAAAAVSVMMMLAACSSQGPSNVALSEAQVVLGDYVGIEAPIEKLEVTDEAVNESARLTITYYNQDAKSDRTVVEDGDSVYITSYLYTQDGELLEDDNGHEGYVNIGSGSTYEDLEQGLIGANVGDELTIPITFPDPYEPDEALSGAKVTGKVTVEYIKGEGTLTLDALTDEQADEILSTNEAAMGYKGVDGFYEFIREDMKRQMDESMEQQVYEKVCEHLLETCTVDPFPDAELKTRVNRYMEQAKDMCTAYYGMTLSEYCTTIGTTIADYEAEVTGSLTDTVKLELIFSAIADKENITYEEDDFQAYVDGIISERSYQSAEELYGEYGEDYVRNAFRIEQTVDWVIKNADVIYTEQTDMDAAFPEPGSGAE